VRSFYLSAFLWKPRPSGVCLESRRLENIPQVPWNRAKIGQNHDARKAVSATLSVLKWSGALFRHTSSKPRVRSFSMCPFLCKARPSRVNLEAPGLENSPQVPGNRAKVGQNHDARMRVSAALWVLKWSGALFRARSLKPSVRSFYLCLLLCKPRPSGVSLKTPRLENIPQVPGNRAKVGQNHDARMRVSATLSVLKWSGALFRVRSSKPSVRSFYLCQFLCKPRPLEVSLEFPRLKNILQIPADQAKDCQNHDARKVFSATLLVLKWSGALFRPRSSKPSVRSF